MAHTAKTDSISHNSNNNNDRKEGRNFRRIWIGGTSGLARTYFNAFQSARRSGRTQRDPSSEPWLLLGHQTHAPKWIANFNGLSYRQVDFTRPNVKAWQQFLKDECAHVNEAILSIRPPLVTYRSFAQDAARNQQIIDGLQTFLQLLLQITTVQHNPTSRLHIIHASSIAAVGHIQEQRLRSEACLPDPSSDSLYHPYDRFKRRCEEVLDDLVPQYTSLRVTHVRLGAFFADDPQCIQCSALALQAHVGFNLPTRIDCNSARNVAVLLQAMLEQDAPVQAIRYFYYTRPLSFSSPLPYGAFVVAYRRGYGIALDLWLPLVILYWIIRCVHACAEFWPSWPFVQSMDYLLQVTQQEHTFDVSLVGAAYPGVVAQEETMLECFRRRRYYLQEGF